MTMTGAPGTADPVHSEKKNGVLCVGAVVRLGSGVERRDWFAAQSREGCGDAGA
jgi:hypothetical protein